MEAVLWVRCEVVLSHAPIQSRGQMGTRVQVDTEVVVLSARCKVVYKPNDSDG